MTVIRSITFTVPGKPRRKTTAEWGRRGNSYKSGGQQETEGNIRVEFYRALEADGQDPADWRNWEGDVALGATFYRKCPKQGKPDIQDIKTPDLKNLIAHVEDALNEVAWVDDRQVSRYLSPSKVVAGKGEQPRTVVTIEHLEESDA